MHTSALPQQPASPPTPPSPPSPAEAPFGIPAQDLAKINEQLAQLSRLSGPAGAQQSGGSFRVLNVGSGPGGVPMNEKEMRALRVQREEMSDQLTNVASRRHELAEQLSNTQGTVARAGLEARIAVIDKRIVDIEREMARTGELVMMAPASLQRVTARGGPSTSTGVPRSVDWTPSDGAVIAISSVFTFAVLMPLAITAARVWWRRVTTSPAPRSKVELDRLERLEGAMETIAIEMERVSEGQRFVTRLLTEGRGESPVFGARRDPVPVPAINATTMTKQGER